MSGDVNELEVDIEAVLDPSRIGDFGVPAGEQLLRFVNAVEQSSGDSPARSELAERVGRPAFVEAAATIAIFNGLVRVADGTGIALDDGILGFSADIRERSGINDFSGAGNSVLTAGESPASSAIGDLFG